VEPPTLRSMTFTKGSLALSVFITPAPTQASATSVHYTSIAPTDEVSSQRDRSDVSATAEAAPAQPAGFAEASGLPALPNASAGRMKSIDELAEQILSQILPPSAAGLRGRPGADERTTGLTLVTATN
jgi:hypothetical protein